MVNTYSYIWAKYIVFIKNSDIVFIKQFDKKIHCFYEKNLILRFYTKVLPN